MVSPEAPKGSRRTRLLVGVWVMVLLAAVAYGVGNAEEELGSKAAAALEEAGLDVASLEMRGRDAVIDAGATSAARIAAVLADVEGLRAVRFVTAPETPTAADDGPAPTTTTTTTVSPSPLPTATTRAPIPEGTSYLVASLRGGQVVIEGAVPSAEVAEGVAFIADLIYSPFIENNLVVDETLTPASWLPNAAIVVARLPIVGTSRIEVVGEDALLTGLAPTEDRLTQLAGAMQQALGPEVTLTTDVTITGFDPPFVRAEAPGDGTVRLSGTMPSVEIVELIAGTAIQVFGEEAVINELAIGENIDTTFSLFRLPLTFVAFQPVPQWEVEIDDDLITGALRGGATFPSGSAELTPELEQLLPIAAGILSRNPTLGMVIEGHTDDVGSDEFNLRLSIDRAEAARAWLLAAGIEETRVFAVGYGEERPIGDNTTSAGRALNRRVEFVLGPASALGGGQ